MAALVLRHVRSFDGARFETFLDAQPDLGSKSRPRYVRLAASLPQTPTNKVLKRVLRGEGVAAHRDPLWVRDARGTSYSPA